MRRSKFSSWLHTCYMIMESYLTSLSHSLHYPWSLTVLTETSHNLAILFSILRLLLIIHPALATSLFIYSFPGIYLKRLLSMWCFYFLTWQFLLILHGIALFFCTPLKLLLQMSVTLMLPSPLVNRHCLTYFSTLDWVDSSLLETAFVYFLFILFRYMIVEYILTYF